MWQRIHNRWLDGRRDGRQDAYYDLLGQSHNNHPSKKAIKATAVLDITDRNTKKFMNSEVQASNCIKHMLQVTVTFTCTT